ncbi:restriction endonuclease-related protein [Actinomadura algeriensis]|uniref:REase associating with pPIWI RE domain-containing protein n=1 Tax=Actinomadura algeriensis TaxID=1679523 RepID=A0ABR9K2P5_9ACTN|nr:hypothetical protein [Actinomadura algeriensis]MBE1537082.1 hypothetical protein [Actinomadura algeriensis]
MSRLVAPPSDDVGERRRRAVTAMLRAAYAWTARRARPEAMREVARMTGFVMEAHGPGRGPATPLALVDALRRPLGELPIFADANDGEDGALREVVLLEPGTNGRDLLSAPAHDLVCEHVVPLDAEAGEQGWLPSWTRMNADQIRARAFAALAGPNDQRLYRASRKFLIEHPAGPMQKLQTKVGESGVRMVPGGYQPIPESALFRTQDDVAWWWPCPDCHWPMAVTREQVQCRYRPHSAVFSVTEQHGTKRPKLSRVDEGHRTKTPLALQAEGCGCVAQGIWRFIVVPGASELRIAAYLEKLGAEVELWPEMDDYDLRVAIGGTELRVDVKEYRSPHRLITDLRASPPAAQVQVLLPRTHEHQVETVSAALPGISVATERRLLQQVRQIKKRIEQRKDGDR